MISSLMLMMIAQSPSRDFAPNTFPVHVIVDERLDPDLIRSLARPQVTLWLTTDSNVLKESTLENVARFDSAWIQLRAPLSMSVANTFKKTPRAGIWAHSLQEAKQLNGRLPGVRRMAIELSGVSVDWDALRTLRPSLLRWRPGGEIDLLSWSAFLQVKAGRKLVQLDGEGVSPICREKSPFAPGLFIEIGSAMSLSKDVFPCGKGNMMVVSPGTELWLLTALAARDRSAELIFEVGSDVENARALIQLLPKLLVGTAR
jgi:hypothetical protein